MRIQTAKHRAIEVLRQGASGPPVVLVHGWMTSGSVFAPVMDNLARAARIFTPDLRGAGRSDPADSYRLDDYARDLISLLEQVGPATIVGHSMGGAIAQLVAAEQPTSVDKLILLNSVPARGMQLPEEAMALFATSAGNRDKQAAILSIACLQLKDAARDQLLDIAATVDDAAIQQSLEAWTTGGFEDRLGAIQAPTHVIATSDPFLSPALLQEAIVDRIDQAQLHVLEGPGHYPMWEDPEQTSALLQALIS